MSRWKPSTAHPTFSNRRNAEERVRKPVCLSLSCHFLFDMNCFKTILLTILLLGACCVAYNYNAYNPNRVLLTSVQTLTFSKSQYTTAVALGSCRFFSVTPRPIPQMKCTGGSAGCSYAPATMQCYNRGTDGRDVQVCPCSFCDA